MALARDRFRPSTVSSMLVPRAAPNGVTESSVGGVVRLPAAAAADVNASAHAANTALLRRQQFLMIHLVDLYLPVHKARGQGFSVGRELQPEGPVHAPRHG